VPRGDGMGPIWGSGPGTGKGATGGSRGAGRMRGTMAGAGPGGDCVCPKCGARVSHRLGAPCLKICCPKCGTQMVRG